MTSLQLIYLTTNCQGARHPWETDLESFAEPTLQDCRVASWQSDPYGKVWRANSCHVSRRRKIAKKTSFFRLTKRKECRMSCKTEGSFSHWICAHPAFLFTFKRWNLTFFSWQAKEVTPLVQKASGRQCWCYCATTAPEKIWEHLQLFQGGKVRILQMVWFSHLPHTGFTERPATAVTWRDGAAASTGQTKSSTSRIAAIGARSTTPGLKLVALDLTSGIYFHQHARRFAVPCVTPFISSCWRMCQKNRIFHVLDHHDDKLKGCRERTHLK